MAFRAVKSGQVTLEQGIRRPLMLLGLALVISLIIGTYNLLKIKKTSVRVTYDKVEFKVGSTYQNSYPVEDYIGPHFNVGNKGKIRRELEFLDEEDPGSNIYFNLHVDNDLFMKISDAILIRKHEKLGDIEYEAYEGDEYEGNLAEEMDVNAGKMVWLLAALVIFAPVAGYFIVFKFLNNPAKYIVSITIGVIAWVLSVIALGFFIRIYRMETKETIKTLKFSSKALTVNGREFPYDEIETVSMTPPYLLFFSASRRELSIRLYDAKKPAIFYVGHRLDDTSSEELTENRTCIYPALYERVRTDRVLASKFKIQ
jgi:hypothetical protein